MNRLRVFAGVLFLLLAVLPAANGQSVTGQISGVVVDPAGAVIPGATVELIHDLSQTVRKYTTESNGSFIFTGLIPGAYSLRVAQPGFKTYEQKGITVAAQERVDLHELALVVGEVNSTVEVSANTVHVATDSSDRSIAIDLQPDRRHADPRPQPGQHHHDAARRADRGVERLPRLERRRHPGRQRRAAGADHPQHGRRGQPGLGQPESGLHFAQHGRDQRGQTADLQLHRRVRRAHRRPVDPDDQERHALLSTVHCTTTGGTNHSTPTASSTTRPAWRGPGTATRIRAAPSAAR